MADQLLNENLFRIEYTTYNGFDNCVWRTTSEEAGAIAESLRKLKHVTDVRVVPAQPMPEGEDRFMMCATCDFMCRLSQLPAGFSLDTDEPDNPWVWCARHETTIRCNRLQRSKGVLNG
ncbi:hypothetical protein [Stenotrophomonas muris]|uniref:hypothetical protein n=1 Tax=Stenotrophomonas muris TaxID=2963283 RepID=UPI00320A3BD3